MVISVPSLWLEPSPANSEEEYADVFFTYAMRSTGREAKHLVTV